MQTLSNIPLVGKIELLLQSMYVYFFHSLKKHNSHGKLKKFCKQKVCKFFGMSKFNGSTCMLTRSQVLNQSQVRTKLFKLRNCGGLGARSQLVALKKVEGRAEAPGWDQEEVTSYSFIQTYIKPTNKLVSSHFGAPLVLGQATGNSRLI